MPVVGTVDVPVVEAVVPVVPVVEAVVTVVGTVDVPVVEAVVPVVPVVGDVVAVVEAVGKVIWISILMEQICGPYKTPSKIQCFHDLKNILKNSRHSYFMSPLYSSALQ